MTDRLTDALSYLASQFACPRDRALKDLAPAADMVLDGLASRGDVKLSAEGCYTVTRAGFARLAAEAPVEVETE